LVKDQPIESLDRREAKLVAIATDRSVPEVMGTVQYLGGTKIKRAVGFMSSGDTRLNSDTTGTSL
jgi:hypothetical protein